LGANAGASTARQAQGRQAEGSRAASTVHQCGRACLAFATGAGSLRALPNRPARPSRASSADSQAKVRRNDQSEQSHAIPLIVPTFIPRGADCSRSDCRSWRRQRLRRARRRHRATAACRRPDPERSEPVERERRSFSTGAASGCTYHDTGIPALAGAVVFPLLIWQRGSKRPIRQRLPVAGWMPADGCESAGRRPGLSQEPRRADSD